VDGSARGHDPRGGRGSGGAVTDRTPAACIEQTHDQAHMVSHVTPIAVWPGVLRSTGAATDP
jgi:hypothetical protein